MRREQNLRKLADLRRQLAELREHSPGLTEDIRRWHEDLCSTVKAVFGHDSDEFSSIASINLEPPPELLEAAEALLNEIVRGGKTGKTEPLIQATYREYIRKRFHDLDDAIASCIFKLRQKNK